APRWQPYADPMTVERGPQTVIVDVVGAAIVDRAGRPTRLLAARRGPDVPHAGRWELPGGKVEPGESPEGALVREIEEELDVTARLLERVDGPEPHGWWPLSPPEARTAYRMAVWLATIEGEPQVMDSHDELRWLGAAELHLVDWLEGDVPVIATLAGRLSP